MVGQNIGKYRVIDRVGRGGMGTVYRALDETLHREVAIKVLNAELNDPEVAKRFRAEAITVARLSHPGIATIYELFQHDGQWLMVMEFVRGETLEHMVARSGGLSADDAAAICMQSLAALAHAHSMGVVHRDLKPANIMRSESGDIKIMDFGIARVSGSEHLTSVGFMMGTPAYMAPEQVTGGDIDARADVYAMGVVLFRLLTGQLPFKGDTPFALAQAQVNAAPIPIEQLRSDLPPWVGPTLSRALEKKPEDRFQSATEFFEGLQRALSGAAGPPSYQSLAATGLVATPSMAMPAPEIQDTVLATPPARAVTPPGPAADAAPSAGPAGSAESAGAQSAAPAGDLPRTPAPVDMVRRPTPAPAGGAGRGVLVTAAIAAVVILGGGGWWWMSSRATTPAAETPPPAVSAPVVETAAPPVPPVADAAPASNTPAAIAAPAASPTPASAGARVGGAGRGAAGRPAASAPAKLPAAVDAAPVVEVNNIRVLRLEGRRAVDQVATLRLGDGRVAASASGGGGSLMSWPYSAVTAATYVHARSPRWNPALAAPPDDLDVGGVFRASRHYLTLQNATEYVILRLEDANVIQVIRELESRTGLAIRRSATAED